MLDCLLQFGIGLLPRLVKLVFGNAQRFVFTQSVPTCGVAAQRAIAITADVIHDAADRGLNLGQVGRAASSQRSYQTSLFGTFQNAHRIIPTALDHAVFDFTELDSCP